MIDFRALSESVGYSVGRVSPGSIQTNVGIFGHRFDSSEYKLPGSQKLALSVRQILGLDARSVDADLRCWIDPKKPNVVFGVGAKEDHLTLARDLHVGGAVNVLFTGAHSGFTNSRFMVRPEAVFFGSELLANPQSTSLHPIDFNETVFLRKDRALSRRYGWSHLRGITETHPGFNYIVNDKNISRNVLDDAGVRIPRGLLGVVQDDLCDRILSLGERVVLKPVGDIRGRGVEFFDSADCNSLRASFLKRVSAGEIFIAEELVRSVPFQINGSPKDSIVRAFVSRDEAGRFITSGMIVCLDNVGQVVNLSLGAAFTSFETYANLIGWTKSQGEQVRDDVERVASRAVEVINETAETNFPTDASDNFIQNWAGVDLIVTKDSSGNVAPVVIEVNGSLSGANGNLDFILPPNQKGSQHRHRVLGIVKAAQRNWESRQS